MNTVNTVKVVFSSTYDIESYHFEVISKQRFEELEKLRGGSLWAVLDETFPGVWETYHGPA